MRSDSNASVSSWLWPALCLALAATLFYFVYENGRLKKQMLEQSGYRPVAQDGAPIGTPARPIEGYLASGERVVLFGDSLARPVILAWFSNDCDACYFAKEGWDRLAGALPGQVWGIRRDLDSGPDSLFFGEPVTFPIVTPIDSTVLETYRVYGTPQTLLIKEDRTVGQVWKGALNPDKVDEIVALAETRK